MYEYTEPICRSGWALLCADLPILSILRHLLYGCTQHTANLTDKRISRLQLALKYMGIGYRVIHSYIATDNG